MQSFSQLTLGIDIDGVVADIDEVLDELALKFTGLPWPNHSANANQNDDCIPAHQLFQILEEFHKYRIPTLQLLPGAKIAIQTLKQHYRIAFITARWASSELLTREWLHHHSLPFDSLYHLDNKPTAPELLAIAIEDHPRHIQAYIANNIKCLVMDHARNRHLDLHHKLVRVSDWEAILKHLL